MEWADRVPLQKGFIHSLLKYFKNEAWTEKKSILCLKIYTIQFMFLTQPYKIIPFTKRQEHC